MVDESKLRQAVSLGFIRRSYVHGLVTYALTERGLAQWTKEDYDKAKSFVINGGTVVR